MPERGVLQPSSEIWGLSQAIEARWPPANLRRLGRKVRSKYTGRRYFFWNLPSCSVWGAREALEGPRPPSLLRVASSPAQRWTHWQSRAQGRGSQALLRGERHAGPTFLMTSARTPRPRIKTRPDRVPGCICPGLCLWLCPQVP